MKERSILFSGPMVRALLDGNKKQTRRLVSALTADRINNCPGFLEDLKEVSSPYGVPGDRLWVREAWRTVPAVDHLPPRELTPAHRIWYEADAPHQPGFGKLRPSMFMPRWVSRITLEITSVRVEQLQDISSRDAIAEGIEACPLGGEWRNYLDSAPNRDALTPRVSFRSLWESINGPGSWDANPWVWVVEFRRLP